MLALAAEARMLPQDLVSHGASGPWTRLAFCHEELVRLASLEAPPFTPSQKAPEVSPGPQQKSNRSGTAPRDDHASSAAGDSRRQISRPPYMTSLAQGEVVRRCSTPFVSTGEF